MLEEKPNPPVGAGGSRDIASGSPARKQIKNSAPRPHVQGARKVYARSPLDRLNWLGQVQGHPQSTAIDVATALVIARFINSKDGYSFASHSVLARLLRVNRRALFKRLSRLADRGHIEVARRGPHPATIAAVILPDCTPENDGHIQDTSLPLKEVHVQDTCSKEKEVHAEDTCKIQKEVHVQDTYTHPKEVHPGDQKRCTRQKIDALKTNSYAPITREEQGNMLGAREFAAPEFDGFEPYYSGPGDGDEFLPDEPVSMGEPPPIESDGLDALAELEASRPEPEGWQEHVAELTPKPAAAPKARPVKWVTGEI